MTMEQRTLEPMQRAAAFVPSTLNREQRTIELTWTTGARGRRASMFEGDWFEELDMSPGSVRLDRLNSGANLLNSHQSRELASILGVIERAWIEGNEGRAVVRFSEREDVEPYWRDVASGIIRNVSVGYQVHRWSDPIRSTDGEPPTYRALDWEPMELSLVSVPFDAGAQVRNAEPNHLPPDGTMSELKSAGGDPAANVEQERSAPAAENVADSGIKNLRLERDCLRIAMAGKLTAEQTDQVVAEGLARGLAAASCMATTMVAERIAATPAPAAPAGPVQPVVTRDEGDTLLRGLGLALQARVMPGSLKGDDLALAREHRGYSILEMARMFLESRGVNTRGMSRTELVTRGFHSTSDFPLLFSNLANKSLDAAYAEEPHTWGPIARQRNLPDFKNASDLVVAGNLTPEPLLEGGEYKAGTLVEGQHQWKLSTYARKITLTRQAIINDDLSAMETVPEMLGRGFRRLESNIIWGLITGNAVTSVDGQVLFHASHNNTGSGAIATAGYNAARKAMRKQTDLAGNTINLTPQLMMVPTDLEATALQFLYPTGFVPAARTGENGPVTLQTAGVQLITEPRLDGSATQWYLACSPTQVEGIVYGYLAGEEGPTIVTNEKRDPDGVEMLARFDFGAAVKDYRFIYRSSGT
jgi:hypothetical protein